MSLINHVDPKGHLMSNCGSLGYALKFFIQLEAFIASATLALDTESAIGKI